MLIPLPFTLSTKALVAWIAMASVHLGLSALLAWSSDCAAVKKRALAQDDSAFVLFLVMVGLLCASVAVIVGLLGSVKSLPTGARGAHVALSMLALGASWLWIHTLFAFHYARRYYQWEHADGDGSSTAADISRHPTGLVFPETSTPDYFDFFYHAVVIGMASQVSDVQVTTRSMRRIVTVHSLLAFAFNVVVLSLGINVVASLLQ